MIMKKDMVASRKKQYFSIIKSNEYKVCLNQMAERIVMQSMIAPNEATIESNFDCELFAFFRENFNCLGFEYNPVKQKTLATARNVLYGRADSAIASLIIEFKQPSALANEKQKYDAIRQISDYMRSTALETGDSCQGFITDGIIGCFIHLNDGDIQVENFYGITGETLDRIIQCIVQVKLLALNARNLVEGLCNPPQNNGISFAIASVLFDIIEKNIHPKTEMLYDEWRQLFNLAHDDISKQQAIIDRKESLERCFNCRFSNVNDEYKALFCLQTAYAIIVKSVAFKVLSQARYNVSLINFYDAMNLDPETLRTQLIDLENGAIFIDYGITNLLEGDFFSWYTNKEQWNDDLASAISNLYEMLSRYSDMAVITSLEKSKDFFKDLYQAMIPAPVRHSLGEYYTPKWLAKKVVETTIDDVCPGWKALDPCCGSGTFLTVLIDKVVHETEPINKKQVLHSILERVQGIDLNPIAVLTARVNYFINIADLMDEYENIEIPVYLGDATYVPKLIDYNGVKCLQYTIATLKMPIDILVPLSMVSDKAKFSRSMSIVETYIKNLDVKSIYSEFVRLVDKRDLKKEVEIKLYSLAEQLVMLEKKEWNGVWARIITNFLSTASLDKFDIIVGNPPWVDWKSLPSGYRDRIKSLCISRKLFSGDVVTGGINLNICALITNVSAENWLSKNGVIAFLMPEPLVFQQSYEGFRNLYIEGNERLFFYRFDNWNKAGHPFKPVTQKFLTFYASRIRQDYNKGIKVRNYIKNKGFNIESKEHLSFNEVFDLRENYLATCHPDKNFFTYVDNEEYAKTFRLMAGLSDYVGREGIEFYPQELMVFTQSNIPAPDGLISLKNMQNKKSKYKVPQRNVLIETAMLHPMIKGRDIVPFHAESDYYIVPFPYEELNPQIPIDLKKLTKKAPNLARYFLNNKDLFIAQTGYNDRIIGKKDAEFYALARVGAYSFASHYVVFRDNTKWAAAVVSEYQTTWGGMKRPVFQNHAVSICENGKGGFISLDEAHYICGILNSNIVATYMMTSSDSRSFPIRPRVKIPEFDKKNKKHLEIAELSKKAHIHYEDNDCITKVRMDLDRLYKSLLQE